MNFETKLTFDVYQDELTELFELSPSYESFYDDLKNIVKSTLWETIGGYETEGGIQHTIMANFITNIDFGELADAIENASREDDDEAFEFTH